MTENTSEKIIPPESTSIKKTKPMPRFSTRFWIVGLGLSLAIDLLFWGKPFGISYGIWIILALAGSFWLTKGEEKNFAPINIILVIAILLTTSAAVARQEPVTRFVNIVLSLLLLLLLNVTYQTGNWLYYRIKDFIIQSLDAVVVSGTTRAASLFSKKNSLNENGAMSTQDSTWKRSIAPVVRGVLLAIPILLVFTALLASSDLIFADYAKNFFSLFRIENLGEYAFRLFYILLLGYVFTGLYLHAILPEQNEPRPDPTKPWMKPFLGWTETSIILAAVNLLFGTFVLIQIRYFFGGKINISTTGYTYAEYARQGASELVIVAILTLMLYLVMKTIAHIENKQQQKWFTFLTVILFGLVLVILVSSYQRLLLYENAYGFTEIRTRTHVFIYWLAGLLLTTVLLDIFKHSERFFLAFLIACIGFGLTLSIMNVEGFIVQKNIERAAAGKSLDVEYIHTLSNDAVPQMVQSFKNSTTSDITHQSLGAELSCRKYETENKEATPWMSFQPADAIANQLFIEISSDLKAFPVQLDQYQSPYVEIQLSENHVEQYDCYNYDNLWRD